MHECAQTGCTIASTGVCLEGIANATTNCPHYLAAEKQQGANTAGVREADLNEYEKSEEFAQPTSAERVYLHDGGALDAEAAASVMREAITRVIVVAGPADSGKTTLVASLYEQFQSGSFGGFLFGGSRTLIGFEHRCFEARLASGRAEPDTERTKGRDVEKFLHLKLASEVTPATPRDLLLSDLPGELFRLARDSQDECERIVALKRADHVAVLIDGAKLLTAAGRITAYDDARILTRSFVEAGMIGTSTILDVVFTKWDLVEGHADRGEIEAYAARIERTLHDQFSSRVGRLNIFRVVARDPNTGGQHGLEELLRSFVQDSLLFSSRRPQFPAEELRSEFDRFVYRFES